MLRTRAEEASLAWISGNEAFSIVPETPAPSTVDAYVHYGDPVSKMLSMCSICSQFLAMV